MGVNLSCRDIAMAKYLGYGAGVDTIHLHQAVESVPQVMDARKVLETGSMCYFYQSFPQPIIVQLMA